MKFETRYEILHQGLAGKIKLKDKTTKEVLPYLFDCIDLSGVENLSVVKGTISGLPKLFDLKTGKVYNYVIRKWGMDRSPKFISMYLLSGNCAIFDTQSKKLRILPKEITETFVNKFCEKNYVLVKLYGDNYTFYHLTRYFMLNVRYSHEEIKKLGYKIHWKDIITRSPEDFDHFPKELIYNKKTLQTCYKMFKQMLEEKKQTLSEDEYKEFKKNITNIFSKRIKSAYPSIKTLNN